MDAVGSTSELMNKLGLKEYVSFHTMPALKKNYHDFSEYVLNKGLADSVEVNKESVRVIGPKANVMDKLLGKLANLGEKVLNISHDEPTMEDIFIQATRRGKK